MPGKRNNFVFITAKANTGINGSYSKFAFFQTFEIFGIPSRIGFPRYESRNDQNFLAFAQSFCEFIILISSLEAFSSSTYNLHGSIYKLSFIYSLTFFLKLLVNINSYSSYSRNSFKTSLGIYY
jgi:hypothetical protein